jgi:hypothetical protein
MFPSFSSVSFSDASPLQHRLLTHVDRCASRFCRQGASLSALSRDDSYFAFDPASLFSTYSTTTSAVSLVASKVSLPSSAASASLIDLLPQPLATLYSDPARLLLPPNQRPAPARAVRLVSRLEWVALVKRLWAANMVVFTTEPACVNGVFAVEKDADSLRLIIDARPCNSQMVVPEPVSLPTPDVLARLQPTSNSPLYFGKIDLDNFYHRLRLPEWLCPWFALPPVRAGEIALPGFDAATLVYPCCATLPMGWSHSVFVAQAAHEHFLATCTSLRPGDALRSTGADVSVDRDRLRYSVYIDDLILVSHSAHLIDDAIAEYCPTAAERGIPAKMSKVHSATSEGLECLGLWCDGQNLTIGVSVPKLQVLMADTLMLLQRRRCSGREMASLIGRWVWAALVRRPVLSVLCAVFRFQQLAGRRTFWIWPSVQRELRLLVGLAPLLFADLGLTYLPRVLASDASSSGLGVVSCTLDPLFLPAVSRDVHQAFPAGMSTNSYAEELPEPLASARWSTIVSSRWRAPEHINSLELRAVSTALRWTMSFPDALRAKVLLLTDSQVAHFALLKGRSSSPVILRRLRSLASLLLGSGLVFDTGWIPSSSNPADGPSRF